MRLLLVTCLAALLLPLTAPPALAAGERCETSGGTERCAEFTPRAQGEQSFAGVTSIVQQRRGVRVRVAFSSVQRRAETGWETVRRTNAPDHRFQQGDTNITSVFCSDVTAGVYRTRGRVEWKRRGGDAISADVATSRGMRKSRLC